jgi:hypothetical protein
MKTILIHAAQPTGPHQVEHVEIHIAGVIPNFNALDEIAEFSAGEANAIEEVLYGSLPGATYDRLLHAMLTRKATHFRVSHNS